MEKDLHRSVICNHCGYEIPILEDEQIEERLNLLTPENHLLKQEILKKDREIERLKKTNGTLLDKLHEKQQVVGVFKDGK